MKLLLVPGTAGEYYWPVIVGPPDADWPKWDGPEYVVSAPVGASVASVADVSDPSVWAGPPPAAVPFRACL